MRSRAAVAILEGAGFTRAASMEGGMKAWNGLLAAGPPEAGIAFFPATATPGMLIALAWYLEAGSRAFYKGLAGFAAGAGSNGLFELLGRAEENHMRTLSGLHLELGDGGDAAAFPQSVLPRQPADAVMEGGVEVEAALSWARNRSRGELLEYTMGLETNSWDLYLRMWRAVTGAAARRVFEVLAEEEKHHLEMLTSRLEETPGGDARPTGAESPP
ncbi:MAG: ferritin family protein [Candidatus Geothermincolia bacterium]